MCFQKLNKIKQVGGIKCAVAQTANENLLENLQSVSAKLLGGGANRMGAEATVAAWDNGQGWVDEMKLILDANRLEIGTP